MFFWSWWVLSKVWPRSLLPHKFRFLHSHSHQRLMETFPIEKTTKETLDLPKMYLGWAMCSLSDDYYTLVLAPTVSWGYLDFVSALPALVFACICTLYLLSHFFARSLQSSFNWLNLCENLLCTLHRQTVAGIRADRGATGSVWFFAVTVSGVRRENH